MVELIKAVQARLRDELDGIRDLDMYITPHVDLIPAGVKAPCVGIKDNGTRREDLAGGMERVNRGILVVIYTQLAKPEANLVGDRAGAKGVLNWAKNVRDALLGEDLPLPGFRWVACPSDAPSETVGDGKEMLQRIVLTVECETEEDQP